MNLVHGDSDYSNKIYNTNTPYSDKKNREMANDKAVNAVIAVQPYRNKISSIKQINHDITQAKSIDKVISILDLNHTLFDISNTIVMLYRLARPTMCFSDIKKIDQVTEKLMEQISNSTLDFPELARILQSYEQLNYRRVDVLQKIANKLLVNKSSKMDQRSLSTIIHAYAHLNYNPPKLLKKVETWFLQDNSKNSKFLIKTAWGLLTLSPSLSEYGWIIKKMNDQSQKLSRDLRLLIERDKMELQMIKLAVSYDAKIMQIQLDPKIVIDNINFDLKEHAAFEYRLLQQDVYDKLLAADSLCEKNVNIQGIMVDCLLAKENYIIETNTVNKFFKNDQKSLTGSSLLKIRILKLMGYHVAIIPYWEWNQCKTDKAKKDYAAEVAIMAKNICGSRYFFPDECH